MSANVRSRLLAAGFFVIAVGFMWWAHRQWLNLSQVSVETAQMPSTRILLWMLTLVATGFLFGMSVSSARVNPGRGRPRVLLTLAFIPFAVLYYFWTQTTLGWFPSLPDGLAGFLYTESTLLAASMILGFFLSGLVGRVQGVNGETVTDADGPVDGDEDVEGLE